MGHRKQRKLCLGPCKEMAHAGDHGVGEGYVATSDPITRKGSWTSHNHTAWGGRIILHIFIDYFFGAKHVSGRGILLWASRHRTHTLRSQSLMVFSERLGHF